jgi:hypothetical protein
MFRCLAERDDADFIFGLRVNHRHWDASKESQGYEPLFTVREAIVFVREGPTFEDARRVKKSSLWSLTLRSDQVNRMPERSYTR